MNLLELSTLTELESRGLIERLRWPEGALCPFCTSKNVTKLGGAAGERGLYKCKVKECRKQFTAFKGSIFEDSHLTCKQWLIAYHLMCSSKKGVSAHQLHRELGITYKSAWFMAHRIRWSMAQPPLCSKIGDKDTPVEADETYVGGKPRRKPWEPRNKCGRGSPKKTPVVALVERGGRIRVKPVERVTIDNLRKVIEENVNRQATLHTDEFMAYRQVGKQFAGHERVNHSQGEFARNGVHVNSAESFFALLKRGVHGIFHHVSKRHLHRYCDEFAFRWDHRGVTDGERTEAAIRQASGKKLLYHGPKGVIPKSA